MGIFKFFKKNKEPKTIVQIETISRNELSEWILNKKKQHQEKEQEFIIPIKERISQFISELRSEISVLEKINIDDKKVELRIKLIIKESLKNYLEHLEKLIEKLNEIDKREKIVEKINFIFEDFNKRSNTSYEKTTFIIGKEMQATKTSIKKFLEDLEKILKHNKKDFEEFEIIQLVEKDISKFKEIQKDKFNLLEILNEDKEKLKALKENLINKEKDSQKLKESDQFKQEENKVKELKLKKQELEKEITSLHNLIDFKSLSNFYHSFGKEMKLVKEYRENFKQTLQKSKSDNLISFLEDAKLANPKILELIKQISNREKQISKISLKDLGINNLTREIGRIKYEIQTIKTETIAKENKLITLDKILDKTIGKIKEELEKIDVELK